MQILHGLMEGAEWVRAFSPMEQMLKNGWETSVSQNTGLEWSIVNRLLIGDVSLGSRMINPTNGKRSWRLLCETLLSWSLIVLMAMVGIFGGRLRCSGRLYTQLLLGPVTPVGFTSVLRDPPELNECSLLLLFRWIFCFLAGAKNNGMAHTWNKWLSF